MTSKKMFDDKTLEKLIRMGVPGFEQDWLERTMKHLNSIRPLQPVVKKRPDPTAFKYSVLVQCVKHRSQIVPASKTPREPFTMPEYPAKEIMAEMMSKLQKQLVKEKLLLPVLPTRSSAARFELTELGRSFVTDYERDHKTKK